MIYVCLACCRAVYVRRPTPQRRSAGTMEIVALTDSSSNRIVLPRPCLFAICDENVTAETSIHLSNHEVEEALSPFIRASPPHMDQCGRVAGILFQLYIWVGHDRRL